MCCARLCLVQHVGHGRSRRRARARAMADQVGLPHFIVYWLAAVFFELFVPTGTRIRG